MGRRPASGARMTNGMAWHNSTEPWCPKGRAPCLCRVMPCHAMPFVMRAPEAGRRPIAFQSFGTKSRYRTVSVIKAISMKYKSIVQRAVQWLAVAVLFSFGLAMAQSEPTLNQVYATAQAGKLDEAQVMIQQVLVSHPKSGKAHFVQAELYARQGKLDLARESLATAEKLSPGLPFAKSEATQALRSQLSSKIHPKAVNSPAVRSPAVSYAVPAIPASTSSSSPSWGLPLLLAGGAIVGGYFFFRRRAPAPMAQQAGYANQGGLIGPQSFGMGGGGAMPPAYPQQPANPQPGYPPQPGSGLGGQIMGGVVTGLAVGAGVMAAEAIGRNLMGHHNSAAGQSNNLSNNDVQPINRNPDMGGSNFGVDDGGSWDDAGSGDAGSGSDWDT